MAKVSINKNTVLVYGATAVVGAIASWLVKPKVDTLVTILSKSSTLK